MKYYASEVVKKAKSWKGCKESNGTHKQIIDTYNKHTPRARGYKVKYTDAWCATYVSAVSIDLGYEKIIPLECSCEKMIEKFKKIGCFVENENRVPKVGDICFYDWNDNGKGDNKGSADHVGIVVNVSRETFTVMEGNFDNQVKERVLKINAKYLRGFGVPKYNSEPSETVSEPSEDFEVTPAIKELAKEIIAGKWGNGSERYERIENATQKCVNEMVKV